MSNTTTDVGVDITNIIRDMLKHFYNMEPTEVLLASTRLRADIGAARGAIAAAAEAALRSNEARDANLRRKLDRLLVSPFRPDVSAPGKRDLWAGLWAVGWVLDDIGWVATHNSEKTLAEVLDARVKPNDYSVPGPISRLSSLLRGSDRRYR